MKKRIVTSLLVGIIAIGQCMGQSMVVNASYFADDKESLINSKEPEDEVITEEGQQLTDEIVELSKNEEEEAAALLNEVEDEEVYEYALKSTLEELYTNAKENRILRFVEAIEDNDVSEKIIGEYQQAEEERKNAENLDYEVDNIIIGYAEKTQEEYISDVAEEQFGKIEQIVETDENIDVAGLSVEKVRQIEAINTEEKDTVVLMEISKGQTVEQAIEEYQQYEGVEYVEPNYKIKTEALTDDTYVESQYYLQDINIEDGWNAVENVSFMQTFVAVIDTGVQLDHPDLKNVLLNKYSVDITQSGYPKLSTLSKTYTDKHGTMVAGVIAAESNNGKGIAGVGTGADKEMARIMALKCSQEAGYLELNAMVNGIYYAVDHGADVINISAGSNYKSIALQNAVDYAYDHDVIVVAGAGNDGNSDLFYPAACEHVVAVAATEDNGKKASYTNYGEWVDISAPGSWIYTCSTGSSYCFGKGTSLAAPIVSGTAAIMSAYGGTDRNGIESILKRTATSLTSSGMGNGLVNSGLAIQNLKYRTFKEDMVSLKSVKPTTSVGKMKIVWEDGVNAEGYVIYRSNNRDGEYVRIKTITDSDTTSYVDTGLKSGKTYYYKVRGYMKYNEGKKYCQYSKAKSGKAN